MHIGEGVLINEVWIPMTLLAAAIIIYAAKKTEGRLGEKNIPMVGVMAAFIFAAQMLNIDVIPKVVSGHMLGGVLAAVFLGPMTASIIMATVFIVQAFLYMDGGITALGANTFNMGLIGTIGGYYIYSLLKILLKGESGRLLAIGTASWLSVILASMATALEVGASTNLSTEALLTAMITIHAVIGLIDAALTIAVVRFVSKARPDLLALEKI